MFVTEKCLLCGDSAKVFTGHVVDVLENRVVIGGFCTVEHANLMKSDERGCFGYYYKPTMGEIRIKETSL